MCASVSSSVVCASSCLVFGFLLSSGCRLKFALCSLGHSLHSDRSVSAPTKFTVLSVQFVAEPEILFVHG